MMENLHIMIDKVFSVRRNKMYRYYLDETNNNLFEYFTETVGDICVDVGNASDRVRTLILRKDNIIDSFFIPQSIDYGKSSW